MEPHPVPQNILEVEFKLFGSFTLKQFSKILFGCLAALIVFFLPFPEILKLPIMLFSVVIGILLAIIPNLGVWISGYLKALFISPRYVWKKETVTPDILKASAKKEVVNRQQVAKVQNQRKVDLSEISLQELFGTRGTTIRHVLEDKNEPVELQNAKAETNLDQLYNQLYTRIQEKKAKQQQNPTQVPITHQAKPVPTQSQQPVVQPIEDSPLGPVTQGVVNQQQKSAVQEEKEELEAKKTIGELETPEDYQNEINRLKQELQNLVKDQNYKERESEILEQINELYQHLKFSRKNSSQSGQIITNEQGERVGNGQHVFGIVVDKQNQPIENASIHFKNNTDDNVITVHSSADGKFTTTEPLYEGEYEVSLDHPTTKFHTFKINVGNQPLPAYKFRAR